MTTQPESLDCLKISTGDEGEHHLTPICDKCSRVYPLTFADTFSMAERLAFDQWIVDEITVLCDDCATNNRAHPRMPLYPDHHPCTSCGRPIFTAWYRGRISYWNAEPGQKCGHQILYQNSTPTFIKLEAQYNGIDSVKAGDVEYPVFRHHRCRQRDIERWSPFKHHHRDARTKFVSTSSNSSLHYTTLSSSITWTHNP